MKIYMIVNFRAYKINQGMHKLTRISTLIKNNNDDNDIFI